MNDTEGMMDTAAKRTQRTTDRARMLRHSNLDLTMQYVAMMAVWPAQERRHAMLRHTNLDLTMQYVALMAQGAKA